jgi:hypothetical protein
LVLAKGAREMSDERERRSGKPERYRLLAEQLDASTKAVYGCTFDELSSRLYKFAYDKGRLDGRADARAEANRKKNLKRYAREDAAPWRWGRRRRGKPPAVNQLDLELLSEIVDEGRLRGETVMAAIEEYQERVRTSKYGPWLTEHNWPLLTKPARELKSVYYNNKTRQKRGSALIKA